MTGPPNPDVGSFRLTAVVSSLQMGSAERTMALLTGAT
jgi:hypothetical protein